MNPVWVTKKCFHGSKHEDGPQHPSTIELPKKIVLAHIISNLRQKTGRKFEKDRKKDAEGARKSKKTQKI